MPLAPTLPLHQTHTHLPHLSLAEGVLAGEPWCFAVDLGLEERLGEDFHGTPYTGQFSLGTEMAYPVSAACYVVLAAVVVVYAQRHSQQAPPKEPALMCRSNNYPSGFYCSWHMPIPTYIPDTFNITVMHDSKEIVCDMDVSLKNRCYIRYLHLFSSKKYKVTLTVTNALGSSSTSISFDEFAIVKPDPPENVVAKPIPNNARRLLVTWQYPSSWPDPDSFPLKFFLRYRPLIIDQWQHVELSDGTTHIITDAYAGKEYIIQVAAKDNEIGTWSDWSVAVHATPWTEEPKHLTTEAQGAETTTASTSAFVVPTTSSIGNSEEQGSDGAIALSWVASLLLVAFSIHFI
ncbi:ciliary neurotrophic factor receptor subunit alpha isoform X3 [Podarcis raffonei]|uniref:ciliary neurotrophic factor receptor subunit alpha isoform X3 n=1 Tax=Podarcis raffonei TaxID=65483 RepID=UPI0023290DE1|nr:ciliary neurotrophic factor receptor subunit alpha isoform X3 [Podarcis raffonei]